MTFSISPKINEGLLHQESESHMTHVGKNISTKDEIFYLVHEETGEKKEISYNGVKSMIEQTLEGLDKEPDQAEHTQ